MTTLSSSKEEAQAILQRSAKLKILLDILSEVRRRNEKVIIFVINKRLQMLLSHCLRILFDIPVSIVNGETKAVSTGRRGASRVEIIRDFEAQDGFGIICMSPLAAGVGLTVTGASNVVHLERHWNPAKEAQATDRVYRIGAPKDVHIYVPVLLHPELQSFDSNLGVLLSKKIDIKDAVVSISPVTGDDFDMDSVFGDNFKDERVTADWLPSMGWEDFEALIAVLAEKIFNGTSYLTPKSGDLGADVIVKDCFTPAVIQCKNSINVFAESNAVLEPYTAAKEYGQKLNIDFKHKILAVNAPSIAGKVTRRAKEFGVEVWDKQYINNLLQQYDILYSVVSSKISNATQ